ncbi:MAG: hypothetical protein R3B96_15145 [Pirellulaceae bacterium]
MEFMERAATWQYSHLSQSDTRYLFRRGEAAFFFADDLHTNDTLATAQPLVRSDVPVTANLQRIDASISDALDLDFYLVDVPNEFAGQAMTIRVHSRDDGRLVPAVTVLSSQGDALAHRTVANGNGFLVVQLDAVETGSYAVLVAGNSQAVTPFDTGNYSLEVRCDLPGVHLATLGQGEVASGETQFHTLRVARSQMFHFGLLADTAGEGNDAVIFATLFDETGKAVYFVATRPGEFRSAQSIMLSPGSYVLRVTVAVGASSVPSPGIAYRFEGLPDSENEGPTLLDPTLSPFPQCDPTRDAFCYPEGSYESPYIWVDGISPDLLPPEEPLNTWDNVDQFYWPQLVIV